MKFIVALHLHMNAKKSVEPTVKDSSHEKEEINSHTSRYNLLKPVVILMMQDTNITH